MKLLGLTTLAVSLAVVATGASAPKTETAAKPVAIDTAVTDLTVASDARLQFRKTLGFLDAVNSLREQPAAMLAPSPGQKLTRDVERSEVVRRDPVPVPVVRPGGPSSAADGPVIEAAGDINVINNHTRIGTAIRRACGGDPNGCPPEDDDYYAVRYTQAEFQRNRPSVVDNLQIMLDEFCSWSANWTVYLVQEDAANPFFPDIASPLAGPVGLNAGAWLPQGTGCGANQTLATVDFNPDVVVPATYIDDGTMSDDFPVGAIDPNWVECPSTGCVGAGTLLQVNGAGQLQVQAAAAGDTIVAPRASDFAKATALRYFHDNISNDGSAVFLPFTPDLDHRFTLTYDLSGAASGRIGVFSRAAFDLGAGLPFNYYSVFVDGTDSSVKIQATDGTLVATTLALAGNPAPFGGTLTVEIEGQNPINFTVSINGTPLVGMNPYSHSDPASIYRGDNFFGNLVGIIAPSAAGGEIADDFIIERPVDLFGVMRFPAGEDIYLLADGEEEGREFFNTFHTIDGGATWNQSGAANGADCERLNSLDTWISLGFRDPVDENPIPIDNLFQINNPITALPLPCCGCAETVPYDCGTANGFKDECAGVQSFSTEYEVGMAIDMDPIFFNEHAPDRPPACPPPAVPPAPFNCRLYYPWLTCNLDGGQPDCSKDLITCLNDGDPNCGIYALEMSATSFPGANSAGVGRYSFNTPAQFIPTDPGDHVAIMWEFYDLDVDGFFDDVDGHKPSHFVQREFTVGGGGCAAPQPYDFDRKSLRMLDDDVLAACPAGELSVYWNPLSLPFDEPANIHEIVGRTQLVSDFTTMPAGDPCWDDPPNLGLGLPGGLMYGCNPWPTAPTFTDQVGGQVCISPAVAADGEAIYYGLYALDCTTGDSMADDK